MSDIPEGYVHARRPRPNPFNEMVGPFYEKRHGKQIGRAHV